MKVKMISMSLGFFKMDVVGKAAAGLALST
jgi:hypothetical protein